MDQRERADQSIDAATRFVASQPGGPGRLLGQHRPNAVGLCVGCGRPGTGEPHTPWPCSVAKIAQVAERT
jgi:hypothetical protein